MMENPYQPQEAVIEKVVTETPNIKTFFLKQKGSLSFATGQFVELTVPGVGEAPFTPSSSPYDPDKLEMTIMDVGRVTSRIHTMDVGEKVGVRGPYGNGYPLEKFHGKEVLLVGGGVGFAPVRCLLLTLLHDLKKYKKVVLCYGARTPQDIVYKHQIADFRKQIEVLLSVDQADGDWKENVGVVTTLLPKCDVDVKNSVAVACGPPLMMKFTTFELLSMGYRPKDIYLSMERKMYCGIGQCRHCALGAFFCCKDGPVFSYDQIEHIPDIWV